MAQKKQAKKSTNKSRRNGQSADARRNVGRKRATQRASTGSTPRPASMENMLEFYKPIKKPVTLRLDADVLGWFRRDGRNYQTRINAALRKIMQREMKSQ